MAKASSKGGKKQPRNPASQSERAGSPVVSQARGRQPPKDRGAPADDARQQLPSGSADLLAGSTNTADLLDAAMDRLAARIEAADKNAA